MTAEQLAALAAALGVSAEVTELQKKLAAFGLKVLIVPLSGGGPGEEK